MLGKDIYYAIKPLIPRQTQIMLRRKLINYKRTRHADIWPIDPHTNKPPENWPGWPDKKRFAVVLTHDVEGIKGQKKCQQLMHMEKDIGFRSSFNFVPERCVNESELRSTLLQNGFEVGVHGLNHDGKLYSSHRTFLERANKINNYIKEWNAVGFRSPAMHHNLDWIHELNIEYDASTFDTDPFEPQSDGVHTIYPFWVANNFTQNGYVELPYTLAQDFTIFILLNEKNNDIWKRKLDWIAENGGMVLMNTHPDYMSFGGRKPGLEEYPVEYYTDFLEYIKNQYEGFYWHVLPKDMSRYWAKSIIKKKM